MTEPTKFAVGDRVLGKMDGRWAVGKVKEIDPSNRQIQYRVKPRLVQAKVTA